MDEGEKRVGALPLPGWARDIIVSGGELLLTHQNGIYAIAIPLVPVIRYRRPGTEADAVVAWKEAQLR